MDIKIKNILGFHIVNKLLAFDQILLVFEFLFDDFFQGLDLKLKEHSQLNEDILKEYNTKVQKEFSVQFDLIRIETARMEFRNKDYPKSWGIYTKIKNANLLNDLDRKLIENCKKTYFIITPYFGEYRYQNK